MNILEKLMVIVLLLLCGVNHAQTDTAQGKPRLHSPEIGIRPQIGFLMAHHTQMLYLVQGHFRLYEVYAEKVVDGKKSWHHAYRMPAVGFSLAYGDMGNPQEMGFSLSGLGYIKYNMVKQKRFGLHFRAGAGLAYLSKWFDRLENNKNSAIAAPYNVCLSLALEPEWKLGPVDLGLIISFTHFSNGAFKTPNLGFNFPAIGLQAGYCFNRYETPAQKQQAIQQYKNTTHKKTLELTLIGGEKEIMPANGPKYFAGDINLLFRNRYSAKSNLLVFADLSYNAAYRKAYENWYKTSVSPSGAIRAGVGIGYGLSMGHLMLFLHNGYYFRDPLDYDGDFYHRIGGRYYFNKGLVANVSLKTHFAKADVIELGIGYAFRLKRPKGMNPHTFPGEKDF